MHYNEEAADSVSQVLDITSLLDRYLTAEIIDDHKCSCGLVGGTERKLNIINVPQLLVIQLLRFTNQFEKIDKFVAFPTELRAAHIKDGNGQQIRYRLTGMIEHTGASIAGGHYIAHFSIDGSWLEANDSRVRELSWETVRALQAYGLFYQRI